MKNYFVTLNNYIKDTYLVIEKIQKLTNIEVSDILGFEISDDVRYIYEHYSEFKLLWSNKNNKYVGTVDFVAYKQLKEAHNKLVSLMYECYDIDEDKDEIAQDIYNWYPLFWFPNGDSFCLDIRNGTVVFYEHELYDSGKNIHSLLISKSINDLFEKWSKIHFADIYYWDEVVNSEGLDLSCDLIKKFL